jgi:hypothetical protein
MLLKLYNTIKQTITLTGLEYEEKQNETTRFADREIRDMYFDELSKEMEEDKSFQQTLPNVFQGFGMKVNLLKEEEQIEINDSFYYENGKMRPKF